MGLGKIMTTAKGKLEEGWCIGSRGRRADGTPCLATHPEAVRWCALGAIDFALSRHEVRDGSEYSSVVRILNDFIPKKHKDRWGNREASVAQYSNSKGQKAAVELFERGIRSLAYQNCLQGLRPRFPL